MSGVASAFPREAGRVIDAMGAKSFLMDDGELGVFTSASVVSATAIPNGKGFFFWNSPVRGGSGVIQAAFGWHRNRRTGEGFQRAQAQP